MANNNNEFIFAKEVSETIVDEIGESIFIAANFFHEKSKKQELNLTKAEVFDAIIYACFSKANKLFKEVRGDDKKDP